MIPAIKDTPFHHADTEAALTLKSAINRAKVKNKTSLRTIAKQLNYKQAAVLSHMASGRIPIPIERAKDIANALDINPDLFMKLVLKQRYPDLAISLEAKVTSEFALLSEVNQSNLPLRMSNATPSQMRIIREVLRDDHATERWLSPHEVYFVNLIRKLRPNVMSDGLSHDDLRKISIVLEQTSKQ